ncbi:PepSY domain-containing protein [Marinobacterium jannaschii]|uniref:PepSY domain-containing protein n=1 Tax=Marinobacterium jannaschii TaxID=64970 RepID=UPI0004858A5F|nr:PepSY domain-containing protein [Marinobacterium jannaschii]
MLKKLMMLALGWCLSISCMAMPVDQGIATGFAQISQTPLQLAGGGLSLKQAARKVQRQEGGQVVKAESARIQGRAMYRIRVVKNGRVKEVLVDAQSGQLSGRRK